VAKALLQVFSSAIEIEGHAIVLGASMGVAVYPDHGMDGAELWRSADAAMYLLIAVILATTGPRLFASAS
jgi:GGDEF domain-containing protein